MVLLDPRNDLPEKASNTMFHQMDVRRADFETGCNLPHWPAMEIENLVLLNAWQGLSGQAGFVQTRIDGSGAIELVVSQVPEREFVNSFTLDVLNQKLYAGINGPGDYYDIMAIDISTGELNVLVPDRQRAYFYEAVRIPALMEFTGFLPPVGGADATGGSFSDPLRTFKLNSTIPLKFTISCGGSQLTTGIHTLQAIKWSSQTDSDPVIDATPTDAATTGNEFRLVGSEWHYNLDTKATRMTVGKWQLIATLSDGSQHLVWIQLK